MSVLGKNVVGKRVKSTKKLVSVQISPASLAANLKINRITHQMVADELSLHGISYSVKQVGRWLGGKSRIPDTCYLVLFYLGRENS